MRSMNSDKIFDEIDGIFQCVPKIRDPYEIIEEARRCSRLEPNKICALRLPRILQCSSSPSWRVSLAKFSIFFKRLFFQIACVVRASCLLLICQLRRRSLAVLPRETLPFLTKRISYLPSRFPFFV